MTGEGSIPPAAEQPAPKSKGWRSWALSVAATSIVVIVAGLLATLMWEAYMGNPWTRDGTMRAYVIDQRPEVSGRIVSLPIVANQFVHKGDLLMVIEPTDYEIAVAAADAAVEQAKANWDNKRAEATRREHLTNLSTSVEEQQTFDSAAAIAQAAYHQDLARLAQARVNFERTRLVAPVDGYVTNLFVQVGDYATAGQTVLALVDSDSFWVDAYLEETLLDKVKVGAPARVKLMGSHTVLRGHVDSVARGISVPNAQVDSAGLAAVNPVFTWIRLAQRIPVRIVIDDSPTAITLAVGRTATVEIVGDRSGSGVLGYLGWSSRNGTNAPQPTTGGANQRP
jgi:multidrug resistance efflux pump